MCADFKNEMLGGDDRELGLTSGLNETMGLTMVPTGQEKPYDPDANKSGCR